MQTVLGALQSEAQPKSWVEHPAWGFLPILGPIIRAVGNVERQARVNQATQNYGLFDTLVQTGQLPEGEAGAQVGQRLQIPPAVLQAGILESAKVRATPGYQARKLFEEAA